jgi:U4/U6.U5 tri-snRNP-associated protein 1
MTDETISVEETNKVRKSIGLPLILVPSVEKNAAKDADSISLDETNRIRISLGLKPIPEQTEVKDDDQVARENWLNKLETEEKTAQQQRLRKKIQESKDRAEARRLLDGQGLADGEDDVDAGAKSWLKKFRMKQRELQQKNLQATEEQMEQVEYTSKNLGGLKVAHKLDDMQNLNQDVVLILKDSSVLDEENELISSTLVEKEKLEENLRAKKGKQRYDEDYDNKTVLSKYDENDEGDRFFVLDGSEIMASAKKTEEAVVETATKKTLITLEDVNVITPSSDYQQAKPANFRKPKKLKYNTAQTVDRKRKRFDDDEDHDHTIREQADDEDLQSILAASRRRVQKTDIKKKKLLTPEELAEKLLQEKDAEETANEETDGLVISETTDFLALIRQNKDEGKDEHVNEEHRTDIGAEQRENYREEDIQMNEISEHVPDLDASNLAPEEPSLAGGIADAVRLLQSRGAIKTKTTAELERERIQKEQRDWVKKTEKDRLIREIQQQRQREQDRLEGKYDGLSQKEREEIAVHENRQREMQEAMEAQRRFVNYKPDVKIEYRDDMGNLLSTKEAYRHMSHQFHGNASGKRKVEKQLQKQAEERKKESRSLFQADPEAEGSTKRKKVGVRLQ